MWDQGSVPVQILTMTRSGNSNGTGDSELRDEQNRGSLPPGDGESRDEQNRESLPQPSETEAAQPVEAAMAEQEVKAGERVVIDAAPSATAIVNEAGERAVIDAAPLAVASVS